MRSDTRSTPGVVIREFNFWWKTFYQLLKKTWKDRQLERLTDKQFYPIFICGVAGSGTSLLNGLLDQNYVAGLCLQESARALRDNPHVGMAKVNHYESLSHYYRSMFVSRNLSPRKMRSILMRLYRLRQEYPKESPVVFDKAPNVHLVRTGQLKASFPESKIILIYRDPVINVEGLRRKWPEVFGQAEFSAVCDFWQNTHEIFLSDIREFEEDVFAVSYAQLVENTDQVLQNVASFCKLKPRGDLHLYPERPNRPGKGIRNIVDGKIRVIQDINYQALTHLSEEEVEFASRSLSQTYNKLKSFTARSNPSSSEKNAK